MMTLILTLTPSHLLVLILKTWPACKAFNPTNSAKSHLICPRSKTSATASSENESQVCSCLKFNWMFVARLKMPKTFRTKLFLPYSEQYISYCPEMFVPKLRYYSILNDYKRSILDYPKLFTRDSCELFFLDRPV